MIYRILFELDLDKNLELFKMYYKVLIFLTNGAY